MMLLLKATNVKNPGSRGGKAWIDSKNVAHYGEKPKAKAPHKYLAIIILSDGTKEYIYARPDELDEAGQVIGGQPVIREIINRELFGVAEIDKTGHFKQTKGVLREYKTRTNRQGKTVIDEIDRHKGYVSFEFRDSSVARAYGGSEEGLPEKIKKYKIAERDPVQVPSKDKITRPERDEVGRLLTHDDPPIAIEDLGIHTVPPRLPDTLVAIGEKLKEDEDPVILATAYLDASMRAMRSSQAKTEAGQARARDTRKHQFDSVAGSREVKPLPAWAVNKFDSPEHLQQELSRNEDGRPLTTLITLGLWNPTNKHKRFREQLTAEWARFIRQWARRYATAYAATDTYGAMDEVSVKDGFVGKLAENSKRKYMYDRERDLYNEAVAVLLHEANTYQANDEPEGPYSRFDLKAQNAIKNHLKQVTKDKVLGAGATALEDLDENEAYYAPKTISPRDHFELKHYEPIAHKIIGDALVGVKPHIRQAFLSRLWIDDHHQGPDDSHERKFNENRARQDEKRGESRLHWGRPWVRTSDDTGIASMADKLSDVIVTLQGGKKSRLGDLKPTHQSYYLQQWYNDALAHIETQLKQPLRPGQKEEDRGLTPDGAVVEKWLRLEQKLATVNNKEIEYRTSIPISPQKMPVLDEPLTTHTRVQPEHIAITFFKQPGSNRELAEKLGIVNDLDMPLSMKNVNLPKQHAKKLAHIEGYHKQLQANLAHVGDLSTVRADAQAEMERHRDIGSWKLDARGNSHWHEKDGITALHEAAVKMHATGGTDDAATKRFTEIANTMRGHPMVDDYVRRLSLLGVDVPTTADLATWKQRAHADYREHANRLHIVEFAQEQRTTKSTVADLRKAFAGCVQAYDRLSKAFR